ncbi:fungal-specific transcription factor domain-containing protein [Aspergillus caelatus]|uniref:Fungal-specific transcription factor domain-containing protein n=1 Tax=Aspergillus caelatus TaxID=61420 RepID=A0A5N7ANJ6_9EURO|nr:fungal-specific transcription factor domain-containing protein [Aspergillus caelatus]KAE8370856.1 fungal-specific transcription factor domain-containing protein [Aspergillus caelatus]
MSSAKPSVTKRACDGCKIRKIRCGGGQPCRSCTKAKIKCTYVRVQQCRGPRRLRSTTQFLIEQAQVGGDNNDCEDAHRSTEAMLERLNPNTTPARQTSRMESSRIPLDTLTSPLSIYHVRMYPVWPIVNVEEMVSALQRDTVNSDNETYALSTAVAAATIAQLRLEQGPGAGETITAEMLAAECLRARNLCDYRSQVNLNSIQTSFFLHVYYENQKPGGSESLLHLREAISIAQIMGLHRESSYNSLSFEEQQLRRRVLWLLFVTERYPVTLKTNISAPVIDENDESHVLPAFLKLLNLFQIFEKSGMFDIIQDENTDMQPGANNVGRVDWPFLESLQRNLQDGSMLFEHISDVQKADLCVTRHWMRMILWKLSAKHYPGPSPSADQSMSRCFPLNVAQELVNIVSQLPRSAVEAHGLGMELKIYEVANSLADAIKDLAVLPLSPEWDGESRPNYILSRLHSILSTFRGGGNKKLIDLLYQKMAEVQVVIGPALTTPLRNAGSRKRWTPPTECETQVHGQQAKRITELANQDPNLSTCLDPLAYLSDANDLTYVSVCDMSFGSSDDGDPNQAPQYSGANDLFQPTYDEAASNFLFDTSSVALETEEMTPLSPLWSSLVPMNAITEDIASQILRASTQDLLFPGAEFTNFATNTDFVGLY